MDEATAELLEQLARLTSDLPWLICLTRREQPGGFTMDEGSVIALGPLPDDEARRLLAAASEAAPLRTHEVEAIVERAGGSPLYLEELLTIARGAGGLEGGLPDSLDAVVGAEIDALPPLTRRLLRYASVLGRSFRPEVLREVVAGEDVALDEVTREQLARHLLPDGNERLVFRHGVLRDAAYGGLSYRRRRDLHRRAGEAIERLAQPDPEGVADALALHFGLAQDHERTWRYARVAGDRARSTYANIEAQDHYERALEGAQQLGTVPPLQRIEVWTALGDVREQAGLFDAALAAFRRATRLVGDDVVAAAALLQRCSRVHERRGAYAAALRLLTEAAPPARRTARPGGRRRPSPTAVVRRDHPRRPGPARAGPRPGRGRGRRGPAHRRGERPGQGLPDPRLGQHPAGPQRRTDPRRRGAGDLRAGGGSRQPGRGAHEPGLCRVLRRLVGRGPGALRTGAGGLPARRQRRPGDRGRRQHRRDPHQPGPPDRGRAPPAGGDPGEPGFGLPRRRGLQRDCTSVGSSSSAATTTTPPARSGPPATTPRPSARSCWPSKPASTWPSA